MVNDFLVHKIVEASDMNWPFCWFRPGGKFGYGWDLRFKFEFWIKWNKNTSIKFLNYIIINTIEYRAATAAKDAKDWSLPSFGSHLNPISTRGGRLCPPYTGVLGWLKFAVAALNYLKELTFLRRIHTSPRIIHTYPSLLSKSKPF